MSCSRVDLLLESVIQFVPSYLLIPTTDWPQNLSHRRAFLITATTCLSRACHAQEPLSQKNVFHHFGFALNQPEKGDKGQSAGLAGLRGPHAGALCRGPAGAQRAGGAGGAHQGLARFRGLKGRFHVFTEATWALA